MSYYEEDYYYNPEDFLEQYEVEIRDVLVEAVNKKIKKTVDELEESKEEIKNLQKTLDEKVAIIRDYDREYKIKLDKTLQENNKENERKLGGGYAPNDIVWIVGNKRTETKCPKCNGDYKMKVDVLGKETEVRCPYCSYGNIVTYEYYPEEKTISSIELNYRRKEYGWANSGIVLYINKIHLDKCEYSKNSEDVYKTLEECQIECNKENEEQEKIK